MILVDTDKKKERELNSQVRLEQLPQRSDQSDDFSTRLSMDGGFWGDDISRTERTFSTDPTSVSTPITDMDSDTFERFLDPALLHLGDTISQLSPSECVKISQSDEEAEFDLPSLESLLNRNSTSRSSESLNISGHNEPAESKVQIRGWVEAAGPDGTLVLEELFDREPDTDVSRPAHTSEEQWLAMQFAHDKPEPVSDDCSVFKESDRLNVKCPICRADVPRPSKNHNKRMNVRQQMASCNDHKLRDAEAE